MALRDTFLNMLGVETPEVQKTSNGAIKSARDFLRYGNREKLYPSWSDIQMPDSDMYRGYSYAVIQKRGNKVASLAKNNLKTWAKQEIVDEYQKREEQVLHPYLKVIEDSTKFTEKQFWKNISIYLDLAGRYYLGVIRNEIKPLNPKLPVITTDPTEFVMLNPYEIRRVIDKNGNVAGYIERKKDGRYREWPLHQIIEMRELNPFDPENSQWAMTDAAKSAVYTINQSSDYTKQSLNGNIDAPGIITTDVLLSDEDFANFRARVTQHVKGEPLFGNGTGAIKWDSMQVDLDKAALMDINEINRTELFAVSGTSKTSLGIEQSGTTRETARVQSEQFISDTAQPRLEDIVDFLNLDYKKYYTREYKKTGYTIEVESAVGRDYDTETKATTLKQTQFQLAMQLIQSGYTTQSAYQFAEGNIEFEDLELEKGLDKPKNPEQPEEPESEPENGPVKPKNGPQSDSGSGDDNNSVPENNSLESAINDLSELEPHADLIENGGKGSGNFGHSGRPGEVGGSAPAGSPSGDVIVDKYEFQGEKFKGASIYDEEKDRTIIAREPKKTSYGFSQLRRVLKGKIDDKKDLARALSGAYDSREIELTGDVHAEFSEQFEKLDEAFKRKKNNLEGEDRLPLTVNGGEGSGNFGHLGRPGLIGGSSKDGYRGISFSKSAEESFKEYPNRKKEFDRVVKEFQKIGLKRGFHFTMNAFDVAAEGEGFFDAGKYSGRTVTRTAEGGSTVFVSSSLLKDGVGKKSNFEKDGKTYEVDDTFEGVLRHELGHLFMTQLFLAENKGKVFGDLNQNAFNRYNSDMLNASKCNKPSLFDGGKWSYYAEIDSGEAIAEAFSNPGYSEDTRKVYNYIKNHKVEDWSTWRYRENNSAEENVIVACVGYPVDDEALKEYMAKVEKNQCTCGHEHKVETFINEVREDEAKIVSEEYKDFLTEVREIEKETIDAVANKLTINAFEPDDIITPKKKKSLLEKLKNAIHNYWWIIFPLFASNSMSKRNEEFDEDIEFVFNNDLQTGVDDNAERVAEGHLETILKDILDASNRAYTKVVENAAAEVIIKIYDENPEKLFDYFDEKPTMADALESIQKTDILEENRKIYEKANKMAFEGFKREDIVKAIRNEYSHISETRATLIARNETARAFGRSQFEADKQFLNSIGKMEQAYKVWYSRRPESEKDKICAFCQELIDRSNANPIPFEEPFLKYGDSMEVVENGKVKIFTANYENIEGGTLHPNCACGYHLVFKNSAGEFVKTLNGGKGSGNFGHSGRPGEVGGSAPQGSQNPEATDESYESLRAEEDSLGYLLELEYGSNIVKYVKEQLGVAETVEKYLDKVPEDMREQMERGLESTKKDLERVVESHKKTLGDDLTAENFEEKYEAYKKSMQTRLDEVRAKIGKMRSEKRTIDLVTDSKTPDMDYIGSEKKRIDIARKSIGIFEDDGSLASDWLNGEIGEAKPEIRKAIEKDKELRQACLSQMYYDSNSKADFKDWLKTPVTLRRVQFSDKVNKDSGFLSFSQYGEWEGTGQGHNKTFPGDILEVKIKPQDTLGSIPTHEGYAYVEGEVMVPTELVAKALEKKQKNSLDKNVNGGKGSGNFGHSGRPGLVGGSAPAGTSPAVAIYVTGEEAKMDFDTILQRRDLQQKLKRMRKIDDFNDDVVAEMKKLQFTDEEIERWRAMILAKEVVHIMDRDKRREKRAQISDSAEQKEAIEKVVDSVEMEDKDKTWLRNNCDVEMAQALSREIDRAKESGIDKIRLKLNDSKSINGRMGYIAGRDEYELTLRKGLLRDTEQTKASRERQGPNGGRYKSSDDIGGTFAHEFGHALETVFAKSLVGDRGIAKSSMYMGEITSFTSRAIVEQAKRNVIAKGIGKEELFRNADNKYMSAYGRTNTREAIAESHANPNFSEFTREIENIVTRRVPIDKDLLDPILNRINFREKQYQEFLHGKD